MGRLKLPKRLMGPHSPDRRPRRAAYVLPTLFTAGNVFLGFLAIVKSFQGAMLAMSGNLGSNPDFELAAKAIGVAVLLDGLDGYIARMTNTTSDFGREMDSLADLLPEVSKPRQSSVRGLGYRALDTEMEDRLSGARPDIGQPPPARVAGTGRAVSAESVANELDVGVVLVGGPVLPKVVQECRPVDRQPMGVEILLREGKRVVDSNQGRPSFREALDQPLGNTASRPVLARTRRWMDFDRLGCPLGDVHP